MKEVINFSYVEGSFVLGFLRVCLGVWLIVFYLFIFTCSSSLYKEPNLVATFFFVTPTQSMVTEGAQKKNYLIFVKNKSLTWWVHGEAVT